MRGLEFSEMNADNVNKPLAWTEEAAARLHQVPSGTSRYEFLYWARQLFEHDSFHIQQPAYPSGYVFWVSEVFDKSPADGGGRRIA